MSETLQQEIDRLAIDNDLENLRKDPSLSDEDFIKFLRNMMTPVRLRISWVGSERTVDKKNQERVAETLNADTESVRTVTKLFDFNDAWWREVKRCRQDAIKLWYKMSIDYPPEPAIRLIRRELIEKFRQEMSVIQLALSDAIVELNSHYSEIIEAAKHRRGDAFKQADYPANLLDSFAIRYDFPSVECAQEIRTLNPQLWMEECQRVRENLDEALHKAEAAYLENVTEMIEFLADKLTPNADGTKKVFRNSALTNIAEFVETFRNTNIGTSRQMKELVDRLERLTNETSVELVRKSAEEQERLKTSLAALNEHVHTMKISTNAEQLNRISSRKVQRLSEYETAPAQTAAT